MPCPGSGPADDRNTINFLTNMNAHNIAIMGANRSRGFHRRDTPLPAVKANVIDLVDRPADRDDLIRRTLAHGKRTAYFNLGRRARPALS